MESAQQRTVSELEAAVLVVRDFAGPVLAAEPGATDRAGARARYCRILATRWGLTETEAHRLVLAAWISMLGAEHPVAKLLTDQHEIGAMLQTDGKAPAELPVPARILRLVTAYQNLKGAPDAGRNLAAIRPALEAACGSDETGRSLLNRFAKLLRDEAFLAGHEAGAGHILLVDPGEAVTPVLEQPLRDAGFEVDVCRDGEAALRHVAAHAADVIVAEKDLPFLDGIALCEKVKADPATARIPFLFITSSRSRNVAARCLKAGAEDVLKKPVDIQWLVLRVQRLLEAAASRAAPRVKESAGGVQGSLSDMSLTDMVQIVSAGAKSMLIELEHAGEKAQVYLQDGDVIHAEIGDAAGEQAFFKLMEWRDGTFATRSFDEPPERTIQVSVTSLLMEGLRQKDERGEL